MSPPCGSGLACRRALPRACPAGLLLLRTARPGASGPLGGARRRCRPRRWGTGAPPRRASWPDVTAAAGWLGWSCRCPHRPFPPRLPQPASVRRRLSGPGSAPACLCPSAAAPALRAGLALVLCPLLTSLKHKRGRCSLLLQPQRRQHCGCCAGQKKCSSETKQKSF